MTASGMPCPDPVCASGPGPVADVTVRLVIAAECGLLRAGIRSVLRAEADFRVVAEVPDALHAVTVARDLVPDVLLLDIDASREALLPALDALADLTTLRILLLASRIAPGEEVEVLARGARGVFFKSSDPPLLVKSIRAILAGDYWVGRDVIGALVQRPLGRARPPRRSNGVHLTAREREITAAIVEGCSNRDIARRFTLSGDTVKHHLTNIFDKTGTGSRLELALFAIDRGLVRDPSADRP